MPLQLPGATMLPTVGHDALEALEHSWARVAEEFIQQAGNPASRTAPRQSIGDQIP